MMRLMFSLLLLSGVARAALPPGPVVSVFGPGEQTVYEVSYMGIPAGRAEITVGWSTEQFGKEVWPLVCVGETTDLAALYPIKDRFITYWDPRERRSVGADFIVQEKNFRAKERYQYERETNTALVKRSRPGHEPTEARYDIEPEAIDLAAAGFWLRNKTLGEGQVHELPVFTGRKQYKMQATVVGKETVSTELGDFEAWKVTVNGDFSGKLATQGLMTLFYTADERQLPVLAEAKLLLGHVRIEAVRYAPGMNYRAGAF